MATLTLIRGLPGSGKSTLAKAMVDNMIADRHQAIHLEADQFFLDQRGNYFYDPDKIRDAHAWCQRTTKVALEQGLKVVVANTFIRIWELEIYIQMAENLAIPFSEIHIETCTANYGSIHNVPEETMERMRLNFEPYP